MLAGKMPALLETTVGGVGPFELDGVATEGAGLPGADVADFAVVVVVPASPWDGIGDRFAELVRGGGGERVESGDSAEATGATGIGHDGIKDVVVDGVVIAAENLAGGAAALGNGNTRGKENEIEGVGSCGRESTGGDLLLEECLDGGVVDGFSWRSGDGDGADEQAAGDLLVGDAIFG